MSEGNPQSVLRDEILADARRQADREVGRAKRDADAILKRAGDEGEKSRTERLEAAREEARRRRQLVLARVPVEVGRMRMARTERALDGVREEAWRRLAERDGHDYRATVVALAAEAIAGMEGRRFVLGLAARDVGEIGPDLAGPVRERVGREGLEVRVDADGAPIEGGVVVRDEAGRQTWNNSLEARLERLWPALRCEIGGRVLAAGDRPEAEERDR